jgi:drug/metabolite transporter (DMT)-like permease
LFLGIKNIGGLQAAMLGLAELIITIIISHFLLGEMLSMPQLIGAGILGASIIMVVLDKQDPTKRHPKGGWLSWIHPPEIKPWSLQD